MLMDVETDTFGPCKGDEAGPGVFDDGSAEGLAQTMAEVDDARRHPGFFEYIHKAGRDGRCIARWFKDDGVPGDDGGGRHAGGNGEGKIPRRDDCTDSQRKVEKLIALAGILYRRRGRGEAKRFARVELKEVNGLGDIGVSFCPVLANFVGKPCAEFELTLANNLRGTEQQRSTLFD